MKMIADTNVLVRAVLNDDAVQSRASRLALSSAEQIVISRHAFCEWFGYSARNTKCHG
jgi:predicted nucleic-acid-binding protein